MKTRTKLMKKQDKQFKKFLKDNKAINDQIETLYKRPVKPIQ